LHLYIIFKTRYIAFITCFLAVLAFTNPLMAGGKDQWRTSFFNQKWLDTVVSIEISKKDTDPIPAGTGFLVRAKDNHILLVTAKHLILDKNRLVRKDLAYRFNDNSDKSVLITDQDMEKNNMGQWFVSVQNDLACRFIIPKKTSRIAVIPQNYFLPLQDVQAGAPILVLGFPLGLRSLGNANPIARRGMVARADKTGIIADAFVFPGNSGGPVLYTPLVKISEPLTSPVINQERLVGLVYGLIPYLNNTNNRSSIIFERNSGLTRVLSADAIAKLINRADVREFEKTLPQKADNR